MKYCQSRLQYHRRKTRVVMVGNVAVGGANPIRIQSMTISDTMNTDATVAEAIELANAGCEIIRITAPSIKEAENLRNIKSALLRRGVANPLVADIHFTPNAAMLAAEYVEKVRINPGNYADKKKFETRDYSDAEYQDELLRIEEKFTPLVLKCKKLRRAMRIGTNHGSLSDRVMNRYGDTAVGMVESAMEFLHICQKNDYHDIILSMKSSNPLVAIEAYRLLAARMDPLGMDYPFHLGVTEAGDGSEGRIKSAVGIGGLLEDGIGDTIRVSLTENAIHEIPVARQLVKRYDLLADQPAQDRSFEEHKSTSLRYGRRQTINCDMVYYKLGGDELPRVEISIAAKLHNIEAAKDEIASALAMQKNQSSTSGALNASIFKAEAIHVHLTDMNDLENLKRLQKACLHDGLFTPFTAHINDPKLLSQAADTCERIVVDADVLWLHAAIQTACASGTAIEINFIERERLEKEPTVFLSELKGTLFNIMTLCQEFDYWNILLSLTANDKLEGIVRYYRYLADNLLLFKANYPILLRISLNIDAEQDMLDSAAQLGSLLCDGIGDSLHIDSSLSNEATIHFAYNLLQAARLRITKTEYISCPSCGRTLFDLQTTTERIKSKTSHLKGVKIAIMGCIVNGPGEMADADFGYVGSGLKTIDLFVGKERVSRNVPEEQADERLIDLIKERGMWVEV